MRRPAQTLLILALTSFCFSCNEESNEDRLLIACSSNSIFLTDTLIHYFQLDHPDLKIEKSSASSGKLYAQIKAGAPFDIFLSADSYYPESLLEEDLVHKVESYAIGNLVLAAKADLGLKSFEDLTRRKDLKLAIANPQLAPYGKAAMESLDFYAIDTKSNVELIIAENIAQCNHFLTSGSVDLALTSASVIPYIKNKKEINILYPDPSSHSPILQKLALISEDGMAENFMEYLLSEKGQKICRSMAYDLP